jgi:8-oxo-dGTP pyrophosphatase MutT (NUDIX family)
MPSAVFTPEHTMLREQVRRFVRTEVMPKGEAWEEAGLVGTVRQRPLGVYEFVKLGKLHEVVVYCMRVSEAKRDWPEKQKRRRRWLRPGKAAERITHLQLREIVVAAFEQNDRAA